MCRHLRLQRHVTEIFSGIVSRRGGNFADDHREWYGKVPVGPDVFGCKTNEKVVRALVGSMRMHHLLKQTLSDVVVLEKELLETIYLGL